MKEVFKMDNVYDVIKKVLQKEKKYLDGRNNLVKAIIQEDALNFDAKLISTLMKEEKLFNEFFKKVDDVVVFDKEKFVWVISNKNFLPNSYTSFKNRIGLVDHREDFISSSQNVTLSFPYKDCVLLGG